VLLGRRAIRLFVGNHIHSSSDGVTIGSLLMLKCCLAQIGAAIGREFSHELIAAVSALAPMDLDAVLERFTVSRLICQRATPPDATYSFKHALVQDAAHRHLAQEPAAALALQHRQSAGRAVRMIDNDSA
jgi:hypothetical protein